MKSLASEICKKLMVKNSRFIEIESKKRVIPAEAKKLKKYLDQHKKIKHIKTSNFLDQFLDTPNLQLLKLGVSLRIRYKGAGSRVYLQYKGPGFLENGILYRSEFSSGKLKNILLEESHHDIIRFSKASIKKIIKSLPPSMKTAMRKHLGNEVLSRISISPIISIYKKERYKINLGGAFLEPSLDRVFAFHINRTGLHPLSTFWELENEVKAKNETLSSKLTKISRMMEFDAMMKKRFHLKDEPLDKYHRCCSIFIDQP